MEKFIIFFAEQFEDTDFSEFKPETKFHELEEWSSLTSLAILNMIEKKYNVKIKSDEMKVVTTIRELYDLILSKS